MTSKHTVRLLTALVGATLAAVAYGETPVGRQPTMNVVLVAMESAADAKPRAAAPEGWQRWETDAPKLLASLEGGAGLARGDVLHPDAGASLFAFRCAAASLGGDETSTLLQERLGSIYDATKRPSLILLWQESGASAALVFHDGTVESLRKSLPLIQSSLGGSASTAGNRLGNPASSFPPCVFASKASNQKSRSLSRQLDGLVNEGKRKELLNLLAVEAFQAEQSSGNTVETVLPAGTTIQTVVMDKQSTAGSMIPQKPTVTVHVTDWGINQNQAGLRTGDDFSRPGVKSAFEDVTRSGQILVVMPPDKEFTKLSDSEITKQIHEGIMKRMSPALASGTTKFEIQNIENMSLAGYANSAHQAAADRWGASFYKAIRMVDGDLQSKGQTPHFDAYLLSNGAKVFADNVNAWGGTITSFAMANGRAFKDSVINAINQVKPQNALLIGSSGDAPAPNNILAKSVGNHDVANEIGKQTGAKVLWLDTLERPNIFVVGHTIGDNPNEMFNVKQTKPDGKSYTTPVKMSWAEIIRPATSAEGLSSAKAHSTIGNPPNLRPDKPGPPTFPDRTLPPPGNESLFFGGPRRPPPQPAGIGGGPPPNGGRAGGSGGGPPPDGGGGLFRPTLASSRFTGPSEQVLGGLFPYTSRMPLTTVRAPTIRPGGILFSPELEIVADTTGLTAARAEQAVAAVKGKAGAEFVDADGKQIIAVKQPGSAKLFQVSSGRFQLLETDIEVGLGKGRSVDLVRFYNSGAKELSELGQGWSFLPFSLRIGSTTKAGKTGFEAAIKPVLIDRERGIEVPYQTSNPDDLESPAPAEKAALAYFATQPGIQPYLTAGTEGGYTLTFAHGFQVRFDKAGRLEWMGRSEEDRIQYGFEGNRLTQIASSTAKIRLKYDEASHLIGAEASDGQKVVYRVSDGGRLAVVSGSSAAEQSFTYASDGRLSRIVAVTADGQKQTLVENAYDNLGRMLSHRAPDGGWTCAYDDNIGCATVVDDSGKATTRYYDGNSRMIASGTSPKAMRLFNYDVYGRIIQVAEGELLNDPAKGERPRFRVVKILSDLTENQTASAKKG